MTKAQSRGYDADLANYLTTPDAWLSKPGPHGIEIGFGMGQGLIEWALAANDWQLLGIELYKPGVGAVSDRLNDRLPRKSFFVVETIYCISMSYGVTVPSVS